MASAYKRAPKPPGSGRILDFEMHVPTVASPKQDTKVSLPLLRAINDSKVSLSGTRMAYAFQTGYPHVSDLGDTASKSANDRAHDTLLLQTQRRELGSAKRNKFKMCGKLTTNGHAYTNLLEGEDQVATSQVLSPDGTITTPLRSPRSHLVGTSMKPEVFHELPYGSECPTLIGDKTSIYRSSFASPRKDGKQVLAHSDGLNDGAMVSPRSVVMPRKLAADHHLLGTPLPPPSPRKNVAFSDNNNNNSSTSNNNSARSAAPRPTVFSATSGNGTSRAQIASDAQVTRELSSLKTSTLSHSQKASLMQSTTITGRF